MKSWWFTMAKNHHPQGPGCVAVIADTAAEARAKMFAVYGNRWAFQYDDFSKIHPLDQYVLQVIQ